MRAEPLQCDAMVIAASAAAMLAALSRELWLVVGATGSITACDPRATAAGFEPGRALRSYALPGTDGKVIELLVRAARERVAGWELALVVGDRPITLVCAAAAAGGQVAISASIVHQDQADALEEMVDSLAEIVTLNRELAKQKRRLQDSNEGIRALHSELEQQTDRLRASAEVKGRLVASVSHELRTPLHSILGLSRLLLDGSDGALNGEQQKQLGFICKSAIELSQMVNDMLDLARLDAGHAPIRREAFALGDFLSAMRGTMMPLLPESGAVELSFDVAPDVALETDQGKIGQIVRNLVSNAIKFTPAGTVQVSATTTGTELQIVVRDTGIGIAASDQDDVFEEFIQIENALQRTMPGTGLGLPLARKLAEALGGRIELVSELGAGSTFTFTTPLVHRDLTRYVVVQRPRSALGPSTASVLVLVIDDDAAARYLVTKHLRHPVYDVVEAADGPTGVILAVDLQPHVILLDFLLGATTAFDVLDALHADPRTRAIPVIIVTSHDLSTADRRTLGDRTSAILSKETLSRELVIDHVREALTGSGSIDKRGRG